MSLLIGDIAFGDGSARDDHVKVAVLVASVTAATLAGILLHARSNVHERLSTAESVDADHDGIPDAYESSRQGH